LVQQVQERQRVSNSWEHNLGDLCLCLIVMRHLTIEQWLESSLGSARLEHGDVLMSSIGSRRGCSLRFLSKF